MMSWCKCASVNCIQPEMQAQTTLINFTVTRDGLEEQLLAAVVAKERPDLEKLKASLTHQQNQFKITLKSLEDSLLARLSTAEGNFLGDYDLVENLETTKRTAMEIEEKVEEAKVTETKINEAREAYRPVAVRASLLYFVLNDLNKIHPMYQFSLKVRHLATVSSLDTRARYLVFLIMVVILCQCFSETSLYVLSGPHKCNTSAIQEKKFLYCRCILVVLHLCGPLYSSLHGYADLSFRMLRRRCRYVRLCL